MKAFAPHELPRALPHFGSAAGLPRFSHSLSPIALIFSTCGPGLPGSSATGPVFSWANSGGVPTAAVNATQIAPTPNAFFMTLLPDDGAPTSCGTDSGCSLQLVLLEERPHQAVGRDGEGRSAEDRCGRFLPRPSIPAALDHHQHHFRPAPARPVGPAG